MKTFLTSLVVLLVGIIVCWLLFAVGWHQILGALGIEYDIPTLIRLGIGCTSFLVVLFVAIEGWRGWKYHFIELPAAVELSKARARLGLGDEVAS